MRVDVPSVDVAPPFAMAVDDPDWISISDLARERGVSRQAISKRAKELSASGKLPTRGDGRSLRIHRPTFDEIVAASHDPAQDLRNRHNRKAPIDVQPENVSTAESPKGNSQPSVYDEASAREKNAKASLAELDLARRMSELVPARELEGAAVEIATTIAQIVSTWKTKTSVFYAAAHQGGEDALHVVLVETVNKTLGEIAESMAKLAARDSRDAD